MSCPAPVFGGFEIAERIRAAIARDGLALETDGHLIAITVSAGLAESSGDSSAALLRRADRALYHLISADPSRD